MDRDDFIIAVYLWVCEHCQAIRSQYRLRRSGFALALTDEEVITMTRVSRPRILRSS